MSTPLQATNVNRPVRLILADDHVVFRQGLSALFEQEGFQIAGEASNGLEAVRLAQTLLPDVAILDSGMPALGGIEAAREIHKLVPGVQTILLTMQEEHVSVVEALRAGMHGYIFKSQTAAELVQTVREVARGALHFSTGITPTEVEGYMSGVREELDPLTERERQVLMMIASGNTTRDIAQSLGLSPKTVESHRNRIMHKLNLHRSAELIRYAVRRHLIRA